LKIYNRPPQQNAINFINYVVGKFPFGIHTIKWIMVTNGRLNFIGIMKICIRHLYIKPRTPRLNGKVECSHSSDKTEFYQLLIGYKNNIDLQTKLVEWEAFYNCHRPHGGLKGQTPYEVLKQKLFINSNNNSKENIL